MEILFIIIQRNQPLLIFMNKILILQVMQGIINFFQIDFLCHFASLYYGFNFGSFFEKLKPQEKMLKVELLFHH